MAVENYSPYTYPDAWFKHVEKLNIHQRIHGAMADLKPLGKDTKTGLKFQYHGHEAVATAIKAVAEKWRFVVTPTVEEHEYQTTEVYEKMRLLCILNVRVRFTNIDKPDDFTETVMVGYGIDESDKGPGKAASYAIKIACLKAFLIHDGEELDNEAFCYQHEREAKTLAEAKVRWAKAVKANKLDMAEEGARVKHNYGEHPSLEDILKDCEALEARAARNRKKTTTPDPEFGADENGQGQLVPPEKQHAPDPT